MTKAMPRGIRLVNASPSYVVGDSANLRLRNPVFLSYLDLRSAWAVFHSITNLLRFLFGNLVSDAFFAILHRSMLPHVKLIISMRSPSQVINVIVAWVAVVVSYISKPLVIWKPEKSYCNEPVGHSSSWLPCRVSEYVGDVSKWCRGSFKNNRLVAPSTFRVWISPFSRLFTPRANLSKLVDFVMLKAVNRFPSFHVAS